MGVVALLLCAADGWGKDPVPDYRPVANWPKLPDDVKLGPVSAVATDSADNVFVFHYNRR